jgi:hypothetical protein
MAAKLARLTENSNTAAPSGRELYHLQFSSQAASPETFGYTLLCLYACTYIRSLGSQTQGHTILRSTWASYLITTSAHLANSGTFVCTADYGGSCLNLMTHEASAAGAYEPCNSLAQSATGVQSVPLHSELLKSVRSSLRPLFNRVPKTLSTLYSTHTVVSVKFLSLYRPSYHHMDLRRSFNILRHTILPTNFVWPLPTSEPG